ETRFLYNHRDQVIDPIDQNGTQVQLVAPEGPVVFGRGTLLPQPRLINTLQLVDIVSLTRGRNLIKFGADFKHIDVPNGRVPIFPTGFSFFAPIDFAVLGKVPGLPFFTGEQAFDPALRTPEEQAFLVVLANVLPTLAPGFPANQPLQQLS